MSLSNRKFWYSNKCLHFSKRVVPLTKVFLAESAATCPGFRAPFQPFDGLQPDLPPPQTEHHLVEGSRLEGRRQFSGLGQARGRFFGHRWRHRDQWQHGDVTDDVSIFPLTLWLSTWIVSDKTIFCKLLTLLCNLVHRRNREQWPVP